MGFEPGHKLSPRTGRLPGYPNKRSAAFLAVLEKHNFCPAEALIETYREARKIYDNYAVIYAAISEAREERIRETGCMPTPTEDQAWKYLKIAADAAKDLASYAYPKLKSVESQTSKPTDSMTPEQQLEAARMIVTMLERKVDSKEHPGGLGDGLRDTARSGAD